MNRESRFASIIYRVIFPVMLLAVTPWIIAIAKGDNLSELVYPIVMGLCLVLLPAWAGYSLLFKRMEQTRRIRLTAVVGCISSVIAMIVIRNHGSETIWRYVCSGLLICLVCVVINQRWTVSAQGTLLAGCVSLALLSSGSASMIVVPLALLSNWSVLTLGKSRLDETVRTWVVVTLCVVTVFALFEMLS